MKVNMNVLLKKLCFKALAILIVLLIVFICIKLLSSKVEKDYFEASDQLIEEYYDNQINTTSSEETSNISLYDSNPVATDTDTEVYSNDVAGVDSILRVKDLGIEMPVCKGNFNADIEAYRLAVYNDKMHLGETTYTIMGHHALNLDIAFGWLEQVELGTYVELEHNGVMFEYVVTDITVHKANELTYLFSLENQDIVYLATCDYSLGLSDNIVYRAVKCERR